MMGVLLTLGIYLNGRLGGKMGDSLLKHSPLLEGSHSEASAEQNRAFAISH